MSYLDGIERTQPVAFHLWRSGGQVYVLLGNLETGEFGDARTPRTVNLCLSRAQLELGAGDYRLQRIDLPAEDVTPAPSDDAWLNYTVTLPPESCAVYVISA